jgi:hypothetical protein
MDGITRIGMIIMGPAVSGLVVYMLSLISGTARPRD